MKKFIVAVSIIIIAVYAQQAEQLGNTNLKGNIIENNSSGGTRITQDKILKSNVDLKKKSDFSVNNDLSSKSSSKSRLVSSNNHFTSTVPTGYKLIGEISSKGVYLFGKVREDSGYYDRMILRVNNKDTQFDWKSSTMKEPKIVLYDFNNDNREELALIFTSAYGTGILKTSIHVIDLFSLQEYFIEEPLDIIKKNVKSKLEDKKVIFSVGNKKFNAALKNIKNSPSLEYKNLYYGEYLYYFINDNKINAYVNAQTNVRGAFAAFIIIYKLEKEKIVLDHIEFGDIERQY